MTAAAYTTVSEIRAAFEERGLSPQRRLGQNFLIDRNLLGLVADAGELGASDVVLEVGAGTGSLTRVLGRRAGAVVAVEVDRGLFDIAEEVCADLPNVSVVLSDALDNGGRLAQSLVGRLEALLRETGARRIKLVANLPYGVATAVMKALVVHGPRPGLMAVTVQSEAARRMAASPGEREYGLMSVLLQACGRVERLRTLAPTVFWPRPNVTSALVRVRLREEFPVDPAQLVATAGKLLEQRRKTLAGALRMAGLAVSKEQAAALLRECGVDPRSRPAALDVDGFVRVTNRLAKEEH